MIVASRRSIGWALLLRALFPIIGSARVRGVVALCPTAMVGHQDESVSQTRRRRNRRLCGRSRCPDRKRSLGPTPHSQSLGTIALLTGRKRDDDLDVSGLGAYVDQNAHQ